jgi:hypothetical protein
MQAFARWYVDDDVVVVVKKHGGGRRWIVIEGKHCG